jgi:Putative zinc-finger
MKRCEELVPLLGPLCDAALPGDDARWVTDHLRGCASCTDRRTLILAQGQALREVLRERAAAADFTGFADKVMARVEKDRHPAPLAAYGSELWGAHKGAFAALGGLALAACLGLAALFIPLRADPDDGALLADARDSQVEEVEFGTHAGAVLQLPQQTTVIWMSDDRAAVEQ